ncbi:indole-3-glycerol phosphate synthase TrpC [Gemmatimonadota bacterium]
MPETQDFPSLVGILERIVRTKRKEIEGLRLQRKALESSLARAPAPKDLVGALRGGGEVAVMAEVKRRSPGAGAIRPDLDPALLAAEYESSGAAAVSVLTDAQYFGGGREDLEAVRPVLSCPLFRKDFILDEIQLLEARAYGADGTLLIVSLLPDGELRTLLAQAEGLGLAPLVEVHDETELDRALEAGSRFIGINNRNLRDFRTSLDVTLELVGRIPPDVTLVSESGIRTPAEVDRLGAAGINAVLVGESLLRAPDPGRATAELVGRPRVPRRNA